MHVVQAQVLVCPATLLHHQSAPRPIFASRPRHSVLLRFGGIPRETLRSCGSVSTCHGNLVHVVALSCSATLCI